jgi:hypothetical protein
MTAQQLASQTIVDGRYTLDVSLEGRALGEIWQCRDKNFRNRAVLLEFLPIEQSDALTHHTHELRAQRALKHPNILPVINQGSHAGRPWVAYDGFEAVSLEQFVNERRRTQVQVDRGTAKDLFAKILEGVTAAHEAAVPILHGVVHPRCVLVKDGTVKVMDFVVGLVVQHQNTVPFRAPELSAVGAESTIASDLFSLGVLLADVLLPQQVGDPRRALEIFLAALLKDSPSQVGRMQRNDVPPGIWNVIARAIQREPAARWDHVHAFHEALDAAWSTLPAMPASSAQPMAATPLPPVALASVKRQPTMAPMFPLGGPQAPLTPRAPTLASPPTPSFVAPTPFAPPPPSASLSSAWDSTPAASVAPPTWKQAPAPHTPPMAGMRATSAEAWDDEQTRAAQMQRPVTNPFANLNDLSREAQESTMALDIDAIGSSFAPQEDSNSNDDWKDSVVVLNTKDDSHEVGVRTSVLGDYNDAIGQLATTRPAMRANTFEPVIPSNVPTNSEATFVASGPLLESLVTPDTTTNNQPRHEPVFVETLRAPTNFEVNQRPKAVTPHTAAPDSRSSRGIFIMTAVAIFLLIVSAVVFFVTRHRHGLVLV